MWWCVHMSGVPMEPGVLNFLGLELQTLVIQAKWVLENESGPPQKQYVHLTTGPFLHPLKCMFCNSFTDDLLKSVCFPWQQIWASLQKSFYLNIFHFLIQYFSREMPTESIAIYKPHRKWQLGHW